MGDVPAREVIRQIAAAMPEDCRGNIVLVGSLAAAYQLFRDDVMLHVRTKDADCVISPRVTAADRGKKVAERLLRAGWTHRTEGAFGEPGRAETATERLPLIRLHPPGMREWFIELLTVRDPASGEWARIEALGGHYALRAFEFSPLLTFEPDETEFGIRCARPAMMVLANLLEHPEIRPERMSGLIAGRAIRRSNKDLGRVLAIAILSGEERTERWVGEWERALRACFPDRWAALGARCGNGLRALLASPDDREEAVWACELGLLEYGGVGFELLRVAGLRLMQDVVEGVELSCADASRKNA